MTGAYPGNATEALSSAPAASWKGNWQTLFSQTWIAPAATALGTARHHAGKAEAMLWLQAPQPRVSRGQDCSGHCSKVVHQSFTLQRGIASSTNVFKGSQWSYPWSSFKRFFIENVCIPYMDPLGIHLVNGYDWNSIPFPTDRTCRSGLPCGVVEVDEPPSKHDFTWW